MDPHDRRATHDTAAPRGRLRSGEGAPAEVDARGHLGEGAREFRPGDGRAEHHHPHARERLRPPVVVAVEREAPERSEPRQVGHERFGEVPVADRDRVEPLTVHAPRVPVGQDAPDALAETDAPKHVPVGGEAFQVLEHLCMSRIPRPGVVPAPGAVERVAVEGHEVARQVGAQRRVERTVDALVGRLAERVGLGAVLVHPQAAHAPRLLEDGRAVPCLQALPRGDETGGAGADDGDRSFLHGPFSAPLAPWRDGGLRAIRSSRAAAG